MSEKKPFAGKVALVTGGSRGIGRAITLRLAAGGADVVINYFRKRDTAEATAEEVRRTGVKAHVIRANVGDPEKIDSMSAEVERTFGRLDIFVNNAASGVARPALDLDVNVVEWCLDEEGQPWVIDAFNEVPEIRKESLPPDYYWWLVDRFVACIKDKLDPGKQNKTIFLEPALV